jgi:LacI family transcriptional regulator
MRELGYVPSPAARAMRCADPLISTQTKCFAMVFGVDTLKANDFFSDVSRGVEKAASKEGICPLHVHWTEDSDASWLRMQAVLSVAGLRGVLMIGEFSESDVEAVLKVNENVVFVDAPPPAGMRIPSVEFDYEGCCSMALEHLAERGAMRPLLMTGPEKHYFSKAMREAAKRNSAKFADFPIVETDFTFGAGEAVVAEALGEGIGFDAVFANDVLCMGALRALSDAKVKVPNDVKVMGFDDIPACGYLTPALSSVRLNKESLGANAVDFIVRGMRNEGEALGRMIIDGEIVVRETTGG